MFEDKSLDAVKKRTHIILLNGAPRSGKDSFARIFEDYVNPNRYDAIFKEHLKFSEPLKNSVHQLFGLKVPHDYFEHSKDTPTDLLGGLTPRQAYIMVGEFIKKNLKSTFFGDVLLRRIKYILTELNAPRHYAYGRIFFVVSDAGFHDEAKPLIEEFGAANITLVGIQRTGTSFEGDSRGNLDLPGVRKYHIVNDGSWDLYKESVYDTLDTILQSCQ
jgi:hypothetical protein